MQDVLNRSEQGSQENTIVMTVLRTMRRQEDYVCNLQGSFAHYCMSFMRCSEIILGPRERCREMLDVIESC